MFGGGCWPTLVVVPGAGAIDTRRTVHVKTFKKLGLRGLALLAVAAAVVSVSASAANAAAPSERVRIVLGSGPLNLDAYDYPAADFRAVLRPYQANFTQEWIITTVGTGLYTIQQRSTGQYLDAYDWAAAGWLAVTRPWQGNDTQVWRMYAWGGGFVSWQQKSTGRCLTGSVAGDMQLTTQPCDWNNYQTFRVVSP
jgi:hypothetical protein